MAAKLRRAPSAWRPAAPLIARTAAFLVVFVVLSGIIGPRIISHGLVERDGFQMYGGAGKALLFGVLALLLLGYRKGEFPQLRRWHVRQLVWLLLSAAALAVAWIAVDHLLSGRRTGAWALMAHAGIIGSVVLAAGATFGPRNLRTLGSFYRRELLQALALAILFFGFLYAVYGLWRVLAGLVLHAVRGLLGVVGIHATIAPPRTLLLSKFGINIAEYCSGIESIALFTALYALVGILDWRRFDRRRFFWIFVPALAVLFIFNILRVFVLILGGYYINPHIAFSLFHTYAGMVFFILYSIIFWSVSYAWMQRKD